MISQARWLRGFYWTMAVVNAVLVLAPPYRPHDARWWFAEIMLGVLAFVMVCLALAE